ncbi:MAG: bacteriohopanetetrol glucosamine biosynthesis glycosyltransferase HpnI [Acidobacteriota bacterium]|nr:bacteriohopanetetrol glucosamine biosynthesis glycosyltransferase HpnI [Acidobacteriota bacterium]
MAFAVEVATTVLTVAGIGYFLAALIASRGFVALRRKTMPAFAPGVTILKSLKGTDPGMLDAFRTHCRQQYAGAYELLFGVSTMSDPAVETVRQLQSEFPDHAIRLMECPQVLGTNGKVSTLAQLVPHAQHAFLLVNDSDITVSPHYLQRVMAQFEAPARKSAGQKPVGMVTALYRGRAHGGFAAKLEQLGIATDFMAGVLLSRKIEGGLHFGLGSTLAVRREALDAIGGFEALADQLADDYELGARIDAAGFRVELCSEVVETAVPDYGWRGFVDHQLRWLRTVRDSRPGGYFGLIVTHGFGWALVNLIASGVSPFSLWLFAMSFFLRLGVAMQVGAVVLGDHDVLANLCLLPVRDVVAMGLWVAGFASNVIVWRGERFEVKKGRLHKVG